MQINLRKANALQAEIRRVIASAAPSFTVSVNEFTDNVDAVIGQAHGRCIDAFDRQIRLTRALYNIRNSVAVANAQAGIPTMLGNIEHADAVIALHEKIIAAGVGRDLAEIQRRLDKMRNSAGDSSRTIYGDRFNNVETSVVTDNALAISQHVIKEQRRDKAKLQDDLLTANVTTTIEITGDDLQILRDEGLL